MGKGSYAGGALTAMKFGADRSRGAEPEHDRFGHKAVALSLAARRIALGASR
jgi:hypothetical protein